MSRPGIEPVTSHSLERTLCQLSYRGRYVMRKPAFAICEQQRRRSACASVQSDQRLCYSLLRQDNTSCFNIQNFKPLASFYCCAGRFEPYLVGNPQDRFSRDEALFYINCRLLRWLFSKCLVLFSLC